MAENLSVEAPDFEKIEKEAGDRTADAARLLWYVLNDEIASSRRGVRAAQERLEPKILVSAPTGATHNLSTQGASVIHFTGSTSFDLTGLRAPEPGKARMVIIHNSGSGTVTIKNQSASSVAENRIQTSTNADETVAQNASYMLIYLSSRWRDVTL